MRFRKQPNKSLAHIFASKMCPDCPVRGVVPNIAMSRRAISDIVFLPPFLRAGQRRRADRAPTPTNPAPTGHRCQPNPRRLHMRRARQRWPQANRPRARAHQSRGRRPRLGLPRLAARRRSRCGGRWRTDRPPEHTNRAARAPTSDFRAELQPLLRPRCRNGRPPQRTNWAAAATTLGARKTFRSGGRRDGGRGRGVGSGTGALVPRRPPLLRSRTSCNTAVAAVAAAARPHLYRGCRSCRGRLRAPVLWRPPLPRAPACFNVAAAAVTVGAGAVAAAAGAHLSLGGRRCQVRPPDVPQRRPP